MALKATGPEVITHLEASDHPRNSKRACFWNTREGLQAYRL